LYLNESHSVVNALLYHLGDDASNLLKAQGNYREMSTPDASFDSKGSDDDLFDFEEDEEAQIDLPETPEAAVATPQSLRPGVVHRLDKDTTGVLLAGMTRKGYELMSCVR
jgi:hypothetical protein